MARCETRGNDYDKAMRLVIDGQEHVFDSFECAAATTSSRPSSRATTRCGSSKRRFGPVLAVTTFRDEAEALEIANDTLYGLGAGGWTRDGSRAFRMARAIQAGRVWTNCYHQYPAHAAFGGYKASGVGRENHCRMLEHYSQTKCMLVSYDPNPLGFLLGRWPLGSRRPRRRSS